MWRRLDVHGNEPRGESNLSFLNMAKVATTRYQSRWVRAWGSRPSRMTMNANFIADRDA
jgi:hypothetical protein